MTGTAHPPTASSSDAQHTIKLPILAFNDVYRCRQRAQAPAGHAVRTSNNSGEDPKSIEPGKTLKAQAEGSAAEPEKVSPSAGAGEIHVAQFAKLLSSIRESWPARQSNGGSRGSSRSSTPQEEHEGRDGLVLFAGDVFNPSVESSVTRGSHMVPLLNAFKLDVACVGNHDFDFGFPHLQTLMSSCNFPWLLSNIVDTARDGKQPEGVKRFETFERCGVKVGVIGLVEEDWIATIPSWPPSFEYRPMVDVALKLSEELRDPKGPHRCDVIIALTHCRLPNDIDLCNSLGAVKDEDVKDRHGVDLVIGGHDHVYYIGRGARGWQGFTRDEKIRGSEKDHGVHLIKSGTDFRDLTEASLTLQDTPEGSIRRKVIVSLTGKHHEITPTSETSPEIEDLVDSLLSTVSKTLSKPVCFSLTPLDVRSEHVRTSESAVGDFVADILLHSYAELLGDKKQQKEQSGAEAGEASARAADACIICGGTLRGDSVYQPGKITLGDVLEILPFDDPVVCLELDGKGIWDTLESALSKWPAQEGRFPIIAGMRVEWDHTRPPMQRVLSVRLVKTPAPNGDSPEDEYERPEDLINFLENDDGTRIEVRQRQPKLGEEIKPVEGGRMYSIITRQYMADGYDGFTALKNRKFLIDDDSGQIMSSILRSFLLGSAYIFRHKQLREEHRKHLSSRTDAVLSKARNKFSNASLGDSPPASSPITATGSSKDPSGSPATTYFANSPSVGNASTHAPDGSLLSPSGRIRRHVVDHSANEIRDALHVGRREHMSEIDCTDGASLRSQRSNRRPRENAPTEPKVIRPQPGGASFTVDASNREELRTMDESLAIISPLIDHRLLDLSADKP